MDNLEKLEEFKRKGYIFALGYAPDYVRMAVGDNAARLIEESILEKAKALSDEDFSENLILIIAKGSRPVSDASLNSFSQQYAEYCQTFEKITGGKARACYINWGPYSSRAATLALEKVLNSSYASCVNFDELALIVASHFVLPFDIITKIEYLYIIDQNTYHLDSKIFIKTIKRLITNTTKPIWDRHSYLMPVDDKNTWKKNMQVFHAFLMQTRF